MSPSRQLTLQNLQALGWGKGLSGYALPSLLLSFKKPSKPQIISKSFPWRGFHQKNDFLTQISLHNAAEDLCEIQYQIYVLLIFSLFM
jgi:hypothetical protein